MWQFRVEIEGYFVTYSYFDHIAALKDGTAELL